MADIKSINNNNLNILIGTPCYGGVIHYSYFDSILKLVTVFNSANVKFNIITIPNESLIQRGRNFYVSMMLTYPEYTHLLFIDADIGFDANQTLNMLLRNKDITCGIYPKKNLNLDKLKSNILTANPSQQQALNNHQSVIEHVTLDYVINIINGHVHVNDNLIEVDYAGTGFMLIKADVIRYMAEMMPETRFNNDVDGYFVNNGANRNNFYSLFDCIIDPVSKRYLSEDYTFMNRAQKLGIKCHADLNVNLSHTGNRTYYGSFMNFLFYHSILGKSSVLSPNPAPDPNQSSDPTPPNQSSSDPTLNLNSSSDPNPPTPDPNIINLSNKEDNKDKESIDPINPKINNDKLTQLLYSDN